MLWTRTSELPILILTTLISKLVSICFRTATPMEPSLLRYPSPQTCTSNRFKLLVPHPNGVVLRSISLPKALALNHKALAKGCRLLVSTRHRNRQTRSTTVVSSTAGRCRRSPASQALVKSNRCDLSTPSQIVAAVQDVAHLRLPAQTLIPQHRSRNKLMVQTDEVLRLDGELPPVQVTPQPTQTAPTHRQMVWVLSVLRTALVQTAVVPARTASLHQSPLTHSTNPSIPSMLKARRQVDLKTGVQDLLRVLRRAPRVEMTAHLRSDPSACESGRKKPLSRSRQTRRTAHVLKILVTGVRLDLLMMAGVGTRRKLVARMSNVALKSLGGKKSRDQQTTLTILRKLLTTLTTTLVHRASWRPFSRAKALQQVRSCLLSQLPRKSDRRQPLRAPLLPCQNPSVQPGRWTSTKTTMTAGTMTRKPARQRTAMRLPEKPKHQLLRALDRSLLPMQCLPKLNRVTWLRLRRRLNR
jgi:hypothetical protein